MKRALILAGVLLMAGVAVFLLMHLKEKPEEGVLTVSGNVEVTEVNVGFKLSGRVTGLFVEEGQKVRAGERLAVLDRAEKESMVLQQRAYLKEAITRLEELRAGARPQEIEQAKADVAQAASELEKARKEYERADVLYKNGAISARQMEAAETAYRVGVSRHKAAAERLSLIGEGPRKEDIRAAGYRVGQAEAALGAAEERLKDTELYAPLDGVVLRRNVERGETVSSGLPLYTIGDLESPWIKVYVKEDKLGLVKLGQKAEVMTDSYPGKVYDGTVTFISSEAEFTPKNVQTREERVKLVFGVKVGVKNIDDELKPGMPADVRIILR